MQIPPIDPREAQSIIEKIKNLDLQTVPVEEIDGLLSILLRGYRIQIPFLKPGFNLYRARICERPKNINEILYPPLSKITKMGRINKIEEQIFYCSESKNTVLFELNPRPRDQVVISKWITTENLIVSLAGYTSSALENLGSDRDIADWDIANYPLGISSGNRLVHEFLGSCFAERIYPGDEHKYKLTIAIGQKLLSSDLVHGLIYPTVSMRGNSSNLAIKTDFVDRAVKFVSVEFFEIMEVKESEFLCKKLYSGNRIENNRIIWHEEPPKWNLKPNQIISVMVESGKWIARDENGNIVEPE